MDDDAKLQADIARLRASKGVQLIPWIRENKVFVGVLALYFGLIALYAGIMKASGENPMVGVVIGVFFGPLAMLRMYVRWKRYR